VSDLDAASAIQSGGPTGEFDADVHPGWAIGGKPNGGYLLAILARAACSVLDTTHPLAISGHFLRAPQAGPATARTEVVRNGRRASTARATLWQSDKPCIDTLISCGELSDGSEGWAVEPTPMPAPEDCVPAGNPDFTIEMFDHVEMRVDPATAPFPKPTGDPTVRFWFRLRDGSPPDVWSLIVASDSGPPTVFNLGRYGWAPTVELTVLLRGRPAPGWLRCESRCNALAGEWFDEECTIWDSEGTLVAQSRQLAIAGTVDRRG